MTENIEELITELQNKVAAVAQSALTNKIAIAATYKKLVDRNHLPSILRKSPIEQAGTITSQFNDLQSYEQIKEFVNTPRTLPTIRQLGYQIGNVITINGIPRTITQSILDKTEEQLKQED